MTTPKKGSHEAVAETDSMYTASPVSSSSSGGNSDSSNSSTSQPSRPSSSGCHTAWASGTPRVSTPRFPVRIGITWKKGEKLEAMDFSRTWYPSKIVEIDEAQKCVLIHFEGWNQRYDEWVPMDSEKLRPVTRHSERKDKGTKKRRIHPHPVSDLPSIYRAGEQVMAKWTDCKKYPAKINRQMEDGMYEVIFYDGVSRLIQAMNIQPMPEEMKNMKLLSMKVPPAPRPKIPFKHIKVSLPESIRRKQEQKMEKRRLSSVGKMMAKKMKRRHSPQEPPDSSGGELPEVSLEKAPGTDGEGSSKTKISPLKVKKFKKSSVECEATVSTLSEVECVKMFGTTPNAAAVSADMTSHPSSAAAAPETAAETSTAEVVVPKTAASNTPPAPPAKKTVMVKDADTTVTSEMQVITSVVEQQTDTAVATQTQTQAVSARVRPKILGSRRTKKRASTDPYHQPKRKRSKSNTETPKVGGITKKRPPALGAGEKAKSLDTGSNPAAPPASSPLVPPVFIPSKAFIVEEDHNPYKCPHQGCNKDFRKENLLAYHIKYYHTEPETPTSSSATAGELASASVTSPLLPPSSIHSPVGTPGSRKRRKKTNSVCSTDSDVSVSSKGKSSSKRQRHDSEISVTTASPDVTGRDLWADVKPPRMSQDSAAEESVAADTEDDDVEADVVNCVCGQRETSGLMIQCEVCMCWQHFTCVDTKNTGVPPANYICLLCENTPGIRDSCRHLCDMGWERRGELPSFPFVSESSAQHLKSIASECNELASTLHGIKAALHSTRRQIKISKEEGDPEFQLWQTDWDNWTKPEEDLTLTPRSVDPDPSPTPSTFLFPPAPHPNTTTTTTSSTARAHLSPTATLSSTHSSSSSSLSPVTAATASSTTNASLSSPSSHHTAHPSSCTAMTTTTIEISMMPESPSLVSQPLATQSEESTASNITPPSGSSHLTFHSPPTSGSTEHLPPQTPSADRGGSLLSIQGRAGNLVRDLFPGPSGDAVSSSTISLYRDSDGKGIKINGNSLRKEELPFTHTGDSSTNSGDSVELAKLSGQFVRGQSQQQGEIPPTSGPRSTLSSSSSQQQKSGETEFQLGISGQHSNTTPTSTSSVSHSEHGRLTQTHANTTTQDVTVPSQNPGSNSNGSVAESKNVPASILDGESEAGNVSKHLTSLYVDVNGGQGHNGGYNDDDQDNDTDTAEESVDPYKNCEHNLLVHVTKVHSDIEKQLELLEHQITELENSEHTNPTIQLSEDNVLNDLPALKKSLGKLSRNLVKVQRLCVHH